MAARFGKKDHLPSYRGLLVRDPQKEFVSFMYWKAAMFEDMPKTIFSYRDGYDLVRVTNIK